MSFPSEFGAETARLFGAYSTLMTVLLSPFLRSGSPRYSELCSEQGGIRRESKCFPTDYRRTSEPPEVKPRPGERNFPPSTRADRRVEVFRPVGPVPASLPPPPPRHGRIACCGLPYPLPCRSRQGSPPQQSKVDLVVVTQPGEPAELIDEKDRMVRLPLQRDRSLEL